VRETKDTRVDEGTRMVNVGFGRQL